MRRFFLLLLVLLLGNAAQAAEVVRVAVAANFRAVLETLKPEFEAAQYATLLISAGSTGQLYAQITNGAPFDVFLSADQERPRQLAKAGLADPVSRITYAIGRLALIVPGRAIPDDGTIPDLADVDRMAIANPRTAPYGAAAMEVLDKLDIAGVQLVLAQSVAGVNASVLAGAAPAGLTALALVGDAPAWTVPVEMHAPLRQDAILLSEAAENATARAFLRWLASPPARQIIETHGYSLD